jgi:hypothetical protein
MRFFKICLNLRALIAAVSFFTGIGAGYFIAVNNFAEDYIRSQSSEESSTLLWFATQIEDGEAHSDHAWDPSTSVKPQEEMRAVFKTAQAPCLWTELKDLAEEKDTTEFSKRVVVTSSHGTSEGTSFLVVGNSNIDKLRCGNQIPARNIILSDPRHDNHFNIHRIDCPPNADLAIAGSLSPSCPSLPRGQHSQSLMTLPPPSSAKNVLCMAPLYGVANGSNGRFLMEYILYHLNLGFDHIVIPNFEVTRDEKLFLFLDSLQQQQQIRIIQWDDEHTSHWLSGFKMYEHGKLPAWNRCYLEYQETANWMIFLDVDELLSVKVTAKDNANTNTSNLQPLLEWMEQQYDQFRKPGFLLKSRVVLSVLDHEIDDDKLLLEQWNALELHRKCPFSCGKFHGGRWKYFVKGHGGGKNEYTGQAVAAPPLPYLLWTHSIHGLDYGFVEDNIMEVIPDEDVAELRHYQAYAYISPSREYKLSDFQSTDSPLPSAVLNKVKKSLVPHAPLYKAMGQGLTWALKNNKNKPLANDVLKIIRHGSDVQEQQDTKKSDF